MNAEQRARVIELLITVIRALIGGEEGISQSSKLFGQMTVDEVLEGLSRWDGKVTMVPREALEQAEFYETEDSNVFGLEVRLWFDGKESDLELIGEVVLGEQCDRDRIVVEDIRVM